MKTQNTQLKGAGPRITSTSAGLLIRLNTYRTTVLALLFAGATLLSTRAASADTITVINTNDSGPGSLRQALVNANNGDTINFDSSLNGQRITLTSGPLSVDKDVTINGPGAKNLAVDGNAQSRVFYVNPGKTVTIDGLTVANGHTFFGGGGIYNDSAALTVTNCTLSGNSTYSGGGGGIYNDAGTLTVTNCMLSGNSAYEHGGGISNHADDGAATLTVTNCTLSGNLFTGFGGGISNSAYNHDATLTVTNSTIDGNSSGKEGGGIFNFASGGDATLTITNSTISGNSASDGGGIDNEADNATIATADDHRQHSERQLGKRRRRRLQPSPRRWRDADDHQQHYQRQLGRLRLRRRHRQLRLQPQLGGSRNRKYDLRRGQFG